MAAAAIAELSVSRDMRVIDAMARLDQTRAGILLLVDAEGRLLRTVTDGDLRRLLLGGATPQSLLASLEEQVPHVLPVGHTARQARDMMTSCDVQHLPVVEADRRVVSVLRRDALPQNILLSTPHMGDDEMGFVGDAFSTNWIAPLGPNVDAFETELANMVGAAHAVAVSSGTAAIHLGLILLGVGRGDVVFCSSLTFVASVNPVLYQGAIPVFIDSEPESWNMSPAALERAFADAKAAGRMPKAVIMVDLYGQCADADPIRALCEAHGVPILEDAAEALGATYKGRSAGLLGDIGVFSFNGNKIITTSGGGILLVPDEDMAIRARFLATQARDAAPHYEHSAIGYNYRMSNVLAGIGRGQLRVLDERVNARRRIFRSYRDGLADIGWIEWMPEPEWSHSTHWLSTCTIRPGSGGPDAATLIRALGDELIEARPVWKPMHRQPLFAGHSYFTHSNLSVSDDLFNHGICLPSGSNLTDDDIEKIISVLRGLAR
jgi:dTDP-4-amino-4,6-dideoxygalactose transaminase